MCGEDQTGESFYDLIYLQEKKSNRYLRMVLQEMACVMMILSLSLVFSLTSVVFSRNVSPDIINKYDKYYSGEASTDTFCETEVISLSRLSKITAILISNMPNPILTEGTSSEGYNNDIESIYKIFEYSTLVNANIKAKINVDQFYVLMFIPKYEFYKIYYIRYILITKFNNQVIEWEKNNDSVYALKYYYFPAILFNYMLDLRAEIENLNSYTKQLKRIKKTISGSRFYLTEDRKSENKDRVFVFNIQMFGIYTNFPIIRVWFDKNQLNSYVTEQIEKLKTNNNIKYTLSKQYIRIDILLNYFKV